MASPKDPSSPAPSGSPAGELGPDQKKHRSVRKVLGDVDRVVIFLFAFGFIGSLCLAAVAGTKALKGDWSAALSVLGTGLLLAGASSSAGGIIGFLFGVPRSAAAEDPAGTRAEGYRPNTNLEQVSDWLTKIIIGVGLTQFPRIIDLFSMIGTQAGPALADRSSGQVVAVSVTILYLLIGFFSGFLIAYLWLPGAFARAAARRAGVARR